VHIMSDSEQGSGVVIGKKCVLTVAHVVAGGTGLKIQSENGSPMFDATTIFQDDDLDVAVICSKQPLGLTPAKFAAKEPAIYDEVYEEGFPFGVAKVLTVGRWQGDDYITAESAPGNSGGGVFNNNGELVGLTDAIVGAQGHLFPHLTVIVDTWTILPLLTKVPYE